MDYQPAKMINLKTQTEQMLQNAVLITEMAIDLKERSLAGEKYVCYLRSLAVRAARAITAMKNSGKSFLVLAQKMANSAIKTMDMVPSGEASFQSLKVEYEKLLVILERELMDVDEHDTSDAISTQEFGQINLSALADKIRYLEAKQKQSDPSFTPQPSNSRTFKPGEDEKYPENWSRESLIDLNNIMNLPPVPENIFIGLSPTRPVRSSSLSSLKSLRKVKLSLQRVAKDSSEEEEESGSEEMDDAASTDDVKANKKLAVNLGNIKEEPSSETSRIGDTTFIVSSNVEKGKLTRGMIAPERRMISEARSTKEPPPSCAVTQKVSQRAAILKAGKKSTYLKI